QVGGVAPPIRLAGEERDALRGGGLVHERRKIRGQRGQRELVDDAMALIIPSLQGGGREKQQGKGREMEGAGRFHGLEEDGLTAGGGAGRGWIFANVSA